MIREATRERLLERGFTLRNAAVIWLDLGGVSVRLHDERVELWEWGSPSTGYIFRNSFYYSDPDLFAKVEELLND